MAWKSRKPKWKWWDKLTADEQAIMKPIIDEKAKLKKRLKELTAISGPIVNRAIVRCRYMAAKS